MKKEILVYRKEKEELIDELDEIKNNVEKTKEEMEIIAEEEILEGMDVDMNEENKESIII